MIVIDASVAVAWFFEDEMDDFAKTSAEQTVRESAVVPPIFPAEVTNALLIASKRGRISEKNAMDAIDRMAELPIRIDASRLGLHEELQLAKQHGLTIYDAMYLALSLRHRVPLLSRDDALLRATAKQS